jgi:hypothetical protein
MGVYADFIDTDMGAALTNGPKTRLHTQMQTRRDEQQA